MPLGGHLINRIEREDQRGEKAKGRSLGLDGAKEGRRGLSTHKEKDEMSGHGKRFSGGASEPLSVKHQQRHFRRG